MTQNVSNTWYRIGETRFPFWGPLYNTMDTTEQKKQYIYMVSGEAC